MADALSHHLPNPDSASEGGDGNGIDETTSHSTVCQLLGEQTAGLKLDRELKWRIQE